MIKFTPKQSKKKKGQPYDFSCKFDDETFSMLKKLCIKHDLNRADIVRQLIKGQYEEEFKEVEEETNNEFRNN